jgi:hypothetical protein
MRMCAANVERLQSPPPEITRCPPRRRVSRHLNGFSPELPSSSKDTLCEKVLDASLTSHVSGASTMRQSPRGGLLITLLIGSLGFPAGLRGPSSVLGAYASPGLGPFSNDKVCLRMGVGFDLLSEASRSSYTKVPVHPPSDLGLGAAY